MQIKDTQLSKYRTQIQLESFSNGYSRGTSEIKKACKTLSSRNNVVISKCTKDAEFSSEVTSKDLIHFSLCIAASLEEFLVD